MHQINEPRSIESLFEHRLSVSFDPMISNFDINMSEIEENYGIGTSD